MQNDIIKVESDRRDNKDKRNAHSKTSNSNKVKVTIDLEEVRSHNLKIKKLAFKYVRKPGKSKSKSQLFATIKHTNSLPATNKPSISVADYSELFACLKTIKGGNSHKRNLIKEVVRECLRFKRKNLANLVDLLQSQNVEN